MLQNTAICCTTLCEKKFCVSMRLGCVSLFHSFRVCVCFFFNTPFSVCSYYSCVHICATSMQMSCNLTQSLKMYIMLLLSNQFFAYHIRTVSFFRLDFPSFCRYVDLLRSNRMVEQERKKKLEENKNPYTKILRSNGAKPKRLCGTKLNKLSKYTKQKQQFFFPMIGRFP